MPLLETIKPTVIVKSKTFQCTRPEDSYIFGNLKSNSARVLRIKVRRCENKPYCKPEQEITDFFKGKYLLFLSNQVRFDEKYFGYESVIKESRIEWIPISTQVQQMKVFEVSKQDLALQDQPISLEQITEIKEPHSFQLNSIASRPFEYDGSEFVAGIDIQNNLDFTSIWRDSYTFFDVLSDTGGMASALISLFLPLVGLLNYNHLESYISSRLFKI